MTDIYLYGFSVLSGIFCPIAAYLGLLAIDFNSADFEGLAIALQCLALLHSTEFFPLYFIVSLDLYVGSFFLRVAVGVLRLLSQLLPGF